MASDNSLLNKILKKFCALPEIKEPVIENPKDILIVRQHNQFGDLLASVSLFRAVKETYPGCRLTVIVSKQNYYAVTKNKFIDKLFVYNQKKFFLSTYWMELVALLRRKYDVVIVPATVSISSTSCILGRLAKAELRVGPNSLDGQPNTLASLFNVRVDLNWHKHPDSHISDFGLDILRSLGISTKNYHSDISFDDKDLKTAKDFASSLGIDDNTKLIGLHVGAGKPPNRWSLDNYLEVTRLLAAKYNCKFYFTGSTSDFAELDYIKKNSSFSNGYFLNKSIPELAAMISISDLFVTNDTGVMHVAGTTSTPQISIFGPTNPYNWAPLGPDKHFVRKSDLINDVTVDEVYSLCVRILEDKNLKDNEHADK